MKRFLALLISVLMALSLVTIPVFAENTDHETAKVNPGSAVAVKPNDAETLDEALNVPGGTLTFVSDGDYPWEIYEDGARSTNMGVSNSESSVKTTVEATEGGEVLQFDFMSFGEGSSFDILQLFIDDERVEYWARVEEVETFGYPLTIGTHEVRWTYKKDGSADKPGDYGWIDNVQILPPQHPEEIEVFDITMYPGQETPAQVRVYPEAAFNKDVTYEIADTSVATVTPEGVVYGVASGVTTLTVTAVDNGVQGFATVTIMEFPTYDQESLNEALNIPGGTLEFVCEDDFPWIAAEDGGATSTNIGAHGTSCSVSTTVNVVGGERIEFDFLCFGEQNSSGRVWDGLHFYVDGSLIEDWGEEFEMLHFSYTLTTGTHVLTWAYEKDDDWSEPGDYAWLDNVHIGDRILPEEIIVKDVTVPAGRRTYFGYTVLPEDAYNKDVTFSTVDASIATVDENGVVYGVAEGTTTLIVTAVDGGAYGTATITVTEALPTVNLYGYMCFSDELQAYPNYWGTFADYDPGIVAELDSAPITHAAASAGNMIYGYNQTGEFYKIDPAQGMIPVYSEYSTNYTIIDMAYDYVNNVMYAIGGNSSGTRSLYTVDRYMGVLIEVAKLDSANDMMTLAIDAEGNAYGISASDGILYSIDLATAHCTQIGSTGLAPYYVQSMTYDMNTNQFFWAFCPGGYSEVGYHLLNVDVTTAEVTSLGRIGSGMEVTGLLTLCDIEVPEPTIPEFTVSFVDNVTGDVFASFIVDAGTVIDEEDYPNPPVHDGFEFGCWSGYNGEPIYNNIIITAKYYSTDVPPVNFIGYVCDNPNGVSGCWGEFADYALEQINCLVSAPQSFAAASVGQKIYGFETNGKFFSIDTTEGMVLRYTGYKANDTILAMAFDYTTNTLYAIANTDNGRVLYTVDRAVGTLTEVGAFDAEANIHTLAIDADGNAYGIGYENAVLYSIDLENAHCTEIGSTGLQVAFVQSMTYDMNTDTIYWAHYYPTGDMYIVDPETAEVTCLGVIGGGAEITGLLTLCDIEVPDPVAPEFTVRFIDGIDGTVIGTVTTTPGFIVEEFPEAPAHEGYEFRGWNNYYPGDALYQDTDIVAGYYNLSEPIANLIGYITAAQGDAPSGMWGAFTDYAPQQIESLGNMKAIYAAASVGTTIYGYTDWGEYFVIDTTESMEPTFLTGYANGWAVLGMAYDYTTETMFAIYIVGADYYLGTVNLETGEVTAVGLFTAPAHIYTLAVDAEGTIYGIGYEDGVLYDIDPETAECTPIGSTGLVLHYIQSMTYDMNTGKLLFANYNNYIKGALYEIDPETANATYYGAIGNGAEVVGLLTLYVPQTPPELGDVNNDGNVNMADAALIIRYSMGIIDETALDVTVADVNGSGNINIEDAVLVIRIALGLA